MSHKRRGIKEHTPIRRVELGTDDMGYKLPLCLCVSATSFPACLPPFQSTLPPFPPYSPHTLTLTTYNNTTRLGRPQTTFNYVGKK